ARRAASAMRSTAPSRAPSPPACWLISPPPATAGFREALVMGGAYRAASALLPAGPVGLGLVHPGHGGLDPGPVPFPGRGLRDQVGQESHRQPVVEDAGRPPVPRGARHLLQPQGPVGPELTRGEGAADDP